MAGYCKSICGKKWLKLVSLFGKSHKIPDLTVGKSFGYPWIGLTILGHEKIIE
jgi:hypothetical protein